MAKFTEEDFTNIKRLQAKGKSWQFAANAEGWSRRVVERAYNSPTYRDYCISSASDHNSMGMWEAAIKLEADYPLGEPSVRRPSFTLSFLGFLLLIAVILFLLHS